MSCELGNLKDKLDDGMESIMELTTYTLNNTNNMIEECFPVDIYRVVTINNQDYQLHLTCQMKKV